MTDLNKECTYSIEKDFSINDSRLDPEEQTLAFDKLFLSTIKDRGCDIDIIIDGKYRLQAYDHAILVNGLSQALTELSGEF